MKTYGVTGGVGMGKSTIGAVLREQGVPVVDTDELARQLVEPGQPALEEIKNSFGAGMLDDSGRLRRSEMAHLVFRDAAARQRLEGILHPRIRSAWQRQLEGWRTEGRPHAAVVIPLLFETNAGPHFEKVICVACTAATQRQRLLQRGWDAEQIRQRLKAQWPVEKKMELANFVIWTEGDIDTDAAQLGRILSEFRNGS